MDINLKFFNHYQLGEHHYRNLLKLAEQKGDQEKIKEYKSMFETYKRLKEERLKAYLN